MILALLLGCTCRPQFTDPDVLLLEQLDTDHSGYLELGELSAAYPESVMALADTNGDARIDVNELARYLDAWSEARYGTPTPIAR